VDGIYAAVKEFVEKSRLKSVPPVAAVGTMRAKDA